MQLQQRQHQHQRLRELGIRLRRPAADRRKRAGSRQNTTAG